MDDCLTRVAATDSEDREACLRPGIARRVSRDFAEIHRGQGLDAEIEAEVAERRPEPRPVFLRECLERHRILQAEHGAPGGIGVNRGECANPGEAGPGIGRVEHLRAFGGRERAAEVALCIERLGFAHASPQRPAVTPPTRQVRLSRSARPSNPCGDPLVLPPVIHHSGFQRNPHLRIGDERFSFSD